MQEFRGGINIITVVGSDQSFVLLKLHVLELDDQLSLFIRLDFALSQQPPDLTLERLVLAFARFLFFISFFLVIVSQVLGGIAYD